MNLNEIQPPPPWEQSSFKKLSEYCDREPTGILDMDGNEIYTGDIVEFYFCADKGHSKVPDRAYTKMRDLVIKDNGICYFVCAFGKSYASRHSDYCRVIGADLALIDT